MSFTHANAQANFRRMMNVVHCELYDEIFVVHFDNIHIYCGCLEEQEIVVAKVLERFKMKH